MTKVTDPFAASPQLMKQWMAVSLAAEKSLEKSLVVCEQCDVPAVTK